MVNGEKITLGEMRAAGYNRKQMRQGIQEFYR